MRKVAVLLLVVLASGCVDGEGQVGYSAPTRIDSMEEEPVPQRLSLTALGLYTYPNPLSQVPNGAFSVANDVVIRRDGIVETRRGYKPAVGTFGSSGDRLETMADFNGTLVAHTTADKVVRYSGGAWAEYAGTHEPPSGRKMRFLQSAKSLYFTTSDGVKRVDELTGSVYDAGVPQATGGTIALSSNGAHATGSVTLSGGAGNVTVTIGGTAVGPVTFAGTDAQTATNTATAINANATVSALVTASAVGTTINLVAVNGGTAGNSITLTATRTAGAATASGSFLTGGVTGPGWFPEGSQVAYRFVWGFRNANNRVILGAPSGRLSLTNPATETVDTVVVTAQVPEWVTTDHFLQVYRADATASASVPAGDDMALVYETYPSTAQIAAGTLTFTDVTPDELKGAPLYSSPNAGVPGSEKFQPPVCTDLAEYKGRVWCSATTQRQRLLLTLLSVDASSGGLTTGSAITLTRNGVREVYRGVNGVESPPNTFNIHTGGTASENVANTAKSLAKCISTRVGGIATAFYVSGEYDSPGQILIESREQGSEAIIVRALGTPRVWTPALRNEVEGDFDLVAVERAGGVVGVSSPVMHGFSVGQQVELVGYEYAGDAALFPAGIKTVATTPDPFIFTYVEAGADGFATGDIFYAAADDEEVHTDPTDAPNGLAYGEYGEGADAVPLSNYLTAGAANYPIRRIIPLGDTLFIFKDEGVFILTGDQPETFSIRAYPTPAKIISAETAVILGNAIYVLTDQGVMTISESGAQVVSRPIEGTLAEFYAGDEALKTTTTAVAFAVSYETEREYHLFLPANSSSTYATQAYVYNYVTRSWVRWTVPATTGYVLPTQGVEMLGSPTSNVALSERKTRTLSDYQDADGVAITSRVDWAVAFGDNPSMYTQWQKCSVFYEADAPSVLTMGMQTELNSSMATGSFNTTGLPYITSYVPTEQARSQRFTLSASGGQVGKRMALTGSAIDYFSSTSTLRR